MYVVVVAPMGLVHIQNNNYSTTVIVSLYTMQHTLKLAAVAITIYHYQSFHLNSGKIIDLTLLF